MDCGSNRKESLPIDIDGNLVLLQEGIQQLHVGVSIFDANFSLVACNRRYLEIFDLPEEMVKFGAKLTPILKLLAKRGEYGPVADIDGFANNILDALRKMEEPVTYERCREGGLYFEANTKRLKSGGYITIHTDITERKLAEKAIKEKEEHLRSILEASPIGVAVMQPSTGQILFCNHRASEMIGPASSVSDLAQEPCFFADAGRWREIMFAYEQGKDVRDVEIEVRAPHGGTFWALTTLEPIVFYGQQAVLIWFYDITEQRRIREQMARMAYHDSLTNLPNRRMFEESLHRAMARAKRLNAQGALLFLDLDGFKRVNDTFGHEMGDHVLRETARRILLCVRAQDTAARLGGDEFAVVMEDLLNSKDAITVANRIISSVSEPVKNQQQSANIGVSIGVAFFPSAQVEGCESDIAPDALIQGADNAMYQAKQAGKGTVRVSEA